RRNRHLAMRRKHCPAANRNWRRQDTANAQPFQAPHRSDNIHDRIHRPYLVKMHVLNRAFMNGRLFASYTSKRLDCTRFYSITERAGFDNPFNLRESTMVMMVSIVVAMTMCMIMMMAVLVIVAMTVIMLVIMRMSVFMFVIMVVVVIMLMVMV